MTEVLKHPLCKDPASSRVQEAYFQRLSGLKSLEQEVMPVVYTAMHGVGCRFVQKAFDAFGHGSSSLRLVAAQCEPDATFPTVAFPNPEEGQGALRLGFQEAEHQGCALVLANDPDADRLAVAEKCGATWHVFTGNELGSLLGCWAWQMWRRRNPSADPSKVCMAPQPSRA